MESCYDILYEEAVAEGFEIMIRDNPEFMKSWNDLIAEYAKYRGKSI